MLKLVPIVVETSRDLGGDRRSNFIYHSPGNSSGGGGPLHGAAHPVVGGGGGGGAPAGSTSPLTDCVWTFFWLAVLLSVAFPLGLLSGQLYVLLSPLASLSGCRPLATATTKALLKGMHLPLVCTQHLVQAKQLISL